MSENENGGDEDPLVDIIATDIGEIKGKGLVPVGSKHTIRKSAFSSTWMVHNTLTADGIMDIDPRHRYNVDLSSMSPDELKVLMLKVGIKTEKQKMKRSDVERLITKRLVEIADDEAQE